LILVDPKVLANYDGEAKVERRYREEFKHDQLVNRSDGVVPLVLINGQVAWQDDGFSDHFGKQKFGRVLKPISVLESQSDNRLNAGTPRREAEAA